MKKLIVFLSFAMASAAWCANAAATTPATETAAQPAVQTAAQPATQTVAQPVAQPAARVVVQTAPVAAQPAAAAQPAVEKEPGIMFCLARGLCNMTTGWLELPRCIVYDNGFIPVFGLFVGIPEGAFLTIARTLSGVYDIVSFGTSGSTFHGKIFPNTIFQAKWQYIRN